MYHTVRKGPNSIQESDIPPSPSHHMTEVLTVIESKQRGKTQHLTSASMYILHLFPPGI